MYIYIVLGCSFHHIIKGNYESPGSLQPCCKVRLEEWGAGERMRRGQVEQEPRKKLRRSHGRAQDQEHMWWYRSQFHVHQVLKTLLEFCMDSASILRVPLSHSLEITVFADTFNVLEYDFSWSINVNLKQFLLLFLSPSCLGLQFLPPAPLIHNYPSQIKEHSSCLTKP